MEAPRNSFFDINNLLNNQEEENLYDNFQNQENDLLFKINSEYEKKNNSIENYAKEPINLTIKIGEKEIPITSFNCTKLENVTEKNLREIENKIKYLPTKQRRDLTLRINCAKKQLNKAEKIPTIRVDTEEFHITCIGYGKYMNLSEEQLKIIKNQMSALPYAEKNKLSSKLSQVIKTKQNQSKEIPTIKIEKEIPITSFNCTKLENVTEKNLIEIENKIKDLPSRKQKYDLTMRINCAKKQLNKAEKIPTIRVDTEEFHITCIGYGEYKNLSKKQLKIIKNRMSDLSQERKNQLYNKLYKRNESKNPQDKEIPTIKIGEKEIPITSFNCMKLENMTKKNLREIENKIEDLPTRKQKYDLTMRINCAKKQLKKAEKIPTIRVDTEEFHITCIGYGEYMNLSEEQLKIIKNQMSDLPYAKKNKLSSKLSKVIKNKQNQSKKIPSIKIGEKEIPTNARKTKKSRIAQDKQNQSSDHFKNKNIQTQDSLLEKNREQEEKRKPIEQVVDTWIAEIQNFTPNFFDSNREGLSTSDKEYFNKNSNFENNQDANNGIREINDYMFNLFHSKRAKLTTTDKEDVDKNSNFEINPELFLSSIFASDTNTMTFTKEQNHQENQQTGVSLKQINTENTLSPLKSKKRRWDAI